MVRILTTLATLVCLLAYNPLLSQVESPPEDSPTPVYAYGKATHESGLSFEPDMVFVKGGTFSMGSEKGAYDERPVHQVKVDDFFICKYEVTQEQWVGIMGDNPSLFDDCPKCPVEGVSWEDTREFLHRLNEKTGMNYRLPTEAEWEYAARGGQKSLGYKYAGSDWLHSVAWYEANSEARTHPVGSRNPNVLGLYDMSGNVWEWCYDWYHYDTYRTPDKDNPEGPADGDFRVVRGGSWFFLEESMRCTSRDYGTPEMQYGNIGLRLVRSAK